MTTRSAYIIQAVDSGYDRYYAFVPKTPEVDAYLRTHRRRKADDVLIAQILDFNQARGGVGGAGTPQEVFEALDTRAERFGNNEHYGFEFKAGALLAAVPYERSFMTTKERMEAMGYTLAETLDINIY